MYIEQDVMQNLTYRSILGSLLYMAAEKKPDISTVGSMLAKFQEAPAPRHWKAMKDVVCYLKKRREIWIHVGLTKGKLKFEVWSDPDWARNNSKRRSCTESLLNINEGPAFCTSRLKTSVAHSTAEAEFNALTDPVCNAILLHNVLTDLSQLQKSPTVFYQDNLGAISWFRDVQRLINVRHAGIKFRHLHEKIVR